MVSVQAVRSAAQTAFIRDSLQQTNLYGSTKGSGFNTSAAFASDPTPIVQIELRAEGSVDAICFTHANSSGEMLGHPWHKSYHTYIIPEGVYIKRISGKYNDRISALKFEFSNGSTWGPFGTYEYNNTFDHTFPSGTGLTFIHGTVNSPWLVGLGFGYSPIPQRPITYATRVMEQGTDKEGWVHDDTFFFNSIYGKRINQIEVRYDNKNFYAMRVKYGDEYGPLRGASKGTARYFDVAADDYITEVTGYIEKGLNMLRFKTAKGVSSPEFGNRKGSQFTIGAQNAILTGFVYVSGDKFVYGLGAFVTYNFPKEIEMDTIEYDFDKFLTLETDPKVVVSEKLENNLTEPAQVTAVSTFVETNSYKTEMYQFFSMDFRWLFSATFELMMVQVYNEIEIGTHFEKSLTTTEEYVTEDSISVTFTATVPAQSAMKGYGKVTVRRTNIPWKATAKMIPINGGPNPIPLTFTGIYENTVHTDVQVVFDNDEKEEE